VARALAPLVRDGMRIVLLEQGARLDDHSRWPMHSTRMAAAFSPPMAP
jgi:hypothetical protein